MEVDGGVEVEEGRVEQSGGIKLPESGPVLALPVFKSMCAKFCLPFPSIPQNETW